MYKEKDSLAFLLLFFILLPYLMTVIILGREACPLSREISLEEYVPAVTASQISSQVHRSGGYPGVFHRRGIH